MELIQGECLEEMKKLKANSVDTILCDPPYGLSFMGAKWDYDVPSIEIWKECLRVLKPGGTALIFAGSRTQHRMACNVEDAGFILKDTIMWLYGSGFPKATDISKHCFGDDKDRGGVQQETAPATPEAKLWNGWKSHGLKPAYEPILVAQKPNEGTYANNALKWGVSGLNIDGGRVEHNEPVKTTNRKKDSGNSWDKDNCGLRNEPGNIASADNKGRFPANIILDQEASKMLDEQSGESKSSNAIRKNNGKLDDKTFGKYNAIDTTGFNDKGGASRFFYCAKASKSERNAGCEGLEEKKLSDGREKEADNAYQRGKTLRQNSHPTVKPLKLMEYLCTLTKTPTKGLVLDPFMGSGTTGIACKNTGRDFIGIEKDPEYFKIAEARIKNTPSKLL